MQVSPLKAASAASSDNLNMAAPKKELDLKEILFSPVKGVASWMQRTDEKIPSLDESLPPSPVDSTLMALTLEDDDDLAMSPSTLTAGGESLSPQNQFDPLWEIVNFFSPPPKKEQKPSQSETTTFMAGTTPMCQDSPKCLNFDAVRVTPAPPPPREVATMQDIYRDARKQLEKMLESAKKVSFHEWWEKARQIDAKELAEKAKSTTQKTAKRVEGQAVKVVDTVKEIEPKQVLQHAQMMAKEVTDAVRSNAQIHPIPWTIIGIISFAILVQYLFFSGSVGTPAMRYWRFSVQVHKRIRGMPSGSIVDRVAGLLQSQVGSGEADQIMESARYTTTATSGQDISLRLSELLDKAVNNEPDFLDIVQERIGMIRENPRHYYNIALSTSKGVVVNVWQWGRQLTTEAFDDSTAL